MILGTIRKTCMVMHSAVMHNAVMHSLAGVCEDMDLRHKAAIVDDMRSTCEDLAESTPIPTSILDQP